MLQFPYSLSIDVYCYQCNDAKEDPSLAAHLAAFGINVQTQTKTEKSMTELVRPSLLYPYILSKFLAAN